MKVMVTGGCGFLGSYVCELYRSKGSEVVSYDNMTKYELSRTGYNIEGARNHNRKFLKNIGVDLIEGDVRDIKKLMECTDGIDFIVHTAAQPAMTIGIEDPELDFSTNVLGTLNALLGAVVSGAGEIVAIDLRNDKLELAKTLGATITFNASNTEELNELISRTGGVDYAFEMAGSAPALELAWNMTRRGGKTITTGLPHPDKRISLSPSSLVVEERTLSGSYLGSCVPVRDVPAYIDLYRKGLLPVDKLMSDKIQLKDINEAFDLLASGETVRQIVVM